MSVVACHMSFSHHAYILVGERESLVGIALSRIEKEWGMKTKRNPDLALLRFDTMTIDDARALKEAAWRTSLTGGRKGFIIAANGIARDAQHALLKTVEEPTEGTHFIFILPSAETLLPTLRSRLETLRTDSPALSKENLSLASDFLHAAAPERLKVVQALIKEVEKADAGNGKLLDFLDALEVSAHGKGAGAALREILEVKKYGRDRSPSWKLLLEHLALVLPKMK